MDISTKILSDITVYMKYARYIPEKKRRETWNELVERNKKMHIPKSTPVLEKNPCTFQIGRMDPFREGIVDQASFVRQDNLLVKMQKISRRSPNQQNPIPKGAPYWYPFKESCI